MSAARSSALRVESRASRISRACAFERAFPNRTFAGATWSEPGEKRKESLLKPKPGNCEISAGNHRYRRNDPHTPCPKPGQASRQKRGDKADDESADRSGSNPSIPVHFRREEVQDGIGNVPETVQAEKNDALRGINRKQREPASVCNGIEERECCPISKSEPAKPRAGHYDPKPPISFMA